MAASVWITLREMDPWFEVLWLCPPSGGANWKPPSPSLWESSAPSFGAADEATLMVRFSVETIPSVTVPVRPSGDPMAMAVSPTLSLPESPSVAGVSPEGLSTLMTARSLRGSVPTIFAVSTLPSLVRTSMVALAVLPSRVTTWVLVRMWPSSSRMIPEPVPPSLPLVALMVTTLGDAFSEAAVMTFTSSLLLTITVPGWLPVLLTADVEPLLRKASLAATTPPPTRPAARMLATRVPTPKAAFRLGVLAGSEAYMLPGCWLAGLVGAAALRCAGTGVVAVSLVGVMLGGRAVPAGRRKAGLLADRRLVLR